MAYTKQEWIDNETLINAERMNHIEDGIEAAGGEAPIEKITVNDKEQPIEDKTVNIDIPITGINVNGDDAPIENHVAKLEVAADVPIEHITVNGTEQEITDKTVDIEVPTKTSELDNDAKFITDDALDGYATEEAVEAVKETADSALEKAEAVEDSAITGINVNGEAAPVENHVAEITVAGGDAPIQKITVNEEEQPIEDKTVNIDIPITGINVNGSAATVEEHIAKLNISAGNVYYGEANGISLEDEYPVDIDDFEPIAGAVLVVRFPNGADYIGKLIIDEKEYIVRTKDVDIGFEVSIEGADIYLMFICTGREFYADPALHMANMLEESALQGITVNGTSAPVTDHIAEISAATTEDLENVKSTADTAQTKVNELENDLLNVESDLDGVRDTADEAKTAAEDAKSSIPTKVSELENDSGYVTNAALGEYAKQDDLDAVQKTAEDAQNTADDALMGLQSAVTIANTAQSTANEAKDAVSEVRETATDAMDLANSAKENAESAMDLANSAKENAESAQSTANDALSRVQTVEETAITAITVNGDSVPVNNNTAEITVSGGESAIEHIQVNGEEQEIVDKTVNLAIDRASVDDETLVVGDTTGGGKDVYTGVLNDTVTVSPFSEGLITIAHEKIGGAVEVFIDVNGDVWDVAGGSVGSLVSFDVSDGTLTMTNNTGYEISYIIIT